MMKSILILLGAIGVQACQRDLTLAHGHRHVKRQDTSAAFPPVLDVNEQILINSFDNTSIAEWSYYYSELRSNSLTATTLTCIQLTGTTLLVSTRQWLSGQQTNGRRTGLRPD